MIRYYGVYARHRKTDKSLFKSIPDEKRPFYLSMNKWRNSIAFHFGYDPLKCSCCGNQMTLLDIFVNHKHVPLDDLFRKAIEKY